MAIEKFCNYCKTSGFNCEKPHTLGQPKARMMVLRRGSQIPVLEPIENCSTRSKIQGDVAKLTGRN